MSRYTDVADSTVRVTCGTSIGSGFVFRASNLVVTCAHVVSSGGLVFVADERGLDLPGRIVEISTEEDWALVRLHRETSVTPLEPSGSYELGDGVIFAGYPHGLATLVVHRANISGGEEGRILLDGSVHGGNSGGPLVDLDGRVIGVVSARRYFLEAELEGLRQQALQLQSAAAAAAQFASVSIGGINVGQVFAMVAESNRLLVDALGLNSSTGIAHATPIGPAARASSRFTQ